MASAIPVAHSNPRNMPGSGYSSHYAPRTSSDYSHSSSTSTHQTSYWPNHPASSVSTTSSVAPPRINPGLAAAQFVTKHSSKSRLHKRSKSDPVEDDIEEGVFMGDDAFFGKLKSPTKPKSKVAIKPLLQKLPITSRGNSLDLSRSDGGLPGGVGLGIFDTPYDSSGVDDERVETAFPRNPPRRRHTRNASHTSDGSYGSPGLSGLPAPAPGQPFSHPKRQVPRRGVYTPELSRDPSSNENSDDSDNEEVRETRRIVLSGSARNGNGFNDLNHSGRSTPMLPTLTTSMSDLHSYTRARNPSVASRPSPTTPISPDSFSTASALAHSDSIKSKKPKTRGRILSSHKVSNPIREASPGFVESVTAARLAWERKEEKKAEKLEKKRRQSEAKEEERRTSLTLGRRSFQRGRGNSSSTNTTGNTWTDDTTLASHSSCHLRRKTGSHNSSPVGSLEEHTYDEHEEDSSDDEVFYGRETEEWRERERRKQEKAANKAKKWGGAFGRSSSAAGNGTTSPIRSREKCSSSTSGDRNSTSSPQPPPQRPTTSISEKSYPPGYGPGAMTVHRKGGIKRHWAKFVVWMRIGMVRLGRKMGF